MGNYGRFQANPPTLTNNQTLQWHEVDAAGNLKIGGGGPALSASDEVGNPLPIAGLDYAGDAIKIVAVDSSARTLVVGAAVDGAPASGAPVRIGGKDGTGNTQDILTTPAGVLEAEMQGTGINVAASTYYNAAVSADVDAAVAAAAGVRLVGFAVRETAGAAAVFAIVNGATGAAAGKVFPVNLAANESTSEWLHPGIACASGISIDWVSGAFAIALHYATVV